MTRSLDLTVLRRRGIEVQIIGAHPANYGYPSGAEHQCDPRASVWHITGSAPTPGANPLAGLDSWFNNPAAEACAHIGVSGRHVHVYAEPHVACYHAGVVARPDMGNAVVAGWVRGNQNPNFYSYGIEVVALPGPNRVGRGERLIDDMTWQTMLLVDQELHTQLGLPESWEAHLGHNQIDGVNRARDPVNVYLPGDIVLAHRQSTPPPPPPPVVNREEEEEAMYKARNAAALVFVDCARELDAGRAIPSARKDELRYLLGGISPRKTSAPAPVTRLIEAAGLALDGKQLPDDALQELRAIAV